jgi:putative addiction module component (TIGR02574 family)
MSATFERLQVEAMQLSDAERADLADFLWTSIAERAEIDAAWDVELQRRIDALDAGKTASTPAEDVFAEARRIIAENGT